MPSIAADPEPSPAALTDDERQQYIDDLNKFWDERKAQRQSAHIAAYEARKAELDTSQPAPEPCADHYAGMGGDLARVLRSLGATIKARQESEASGHQGETEPAPKPQQPAAAQEKKSKILNLPLIPATTRAVVNEIASSALFAAIQGKDRKLVKDMPVAATGDTQMFFTGERLNQDDHDVFMQLVYLASAEPLGAYVTVSAHSLLKALGRGTSGKEHKQLDAEIERLKNAGVKIKADNYTYLGSLIHDAFKHEVSGQWGYRLNEKLVALYGASGYTLIDWEQRKRLKGKDLARWLQLEIARHAVPFPIKVETLRERCGSQAKELRDFRRSIKQALVTLQAAGHIAAWRIDENDLVHVDRGAALTASQRRRLALPKPRNRKP